MRSIRVSPAAFAASTDFSNPTPSIAWVISAPAPPAPAPALKTTVSCLHIL
jgi:hypothetical protein